MKQSEKAIQNAALVALSARPNSIYWRNNTGQAWQGQQIAARPGASIVVQPGMVILANARPVTFGLPGSGDIIGADNGVPVVAEAKAAGGRQSDQQARFQRAWEKAGGVYVLFRTPDESLTLITQSLKSR